MCFFIWIWTSSSWSMTPAGTRPGTCCSSRSPGSCSRACAAATRWHDWAAMSSASCCSIARWIRRMHIAETLRQAIRDYRFSWQDGVLTVGVSIGIVQLTKEIPTVANVMSAADVACYSAKDSGRNRVQLYKPDDMPERHREMHWISKLTRARDESRFELFYQPIVPIGANPHRAPTFRADAAPAGRKRHHCHARRVHSRRRNATTSCPRSIVGWFVRLWTAWCIASHRASSPSPLP